MKNTKNLTKPEINKLLTSSNYGFVRQLELDCQLFESSITGNCIVVDWKHNRISKVGSQKVQIALA